MRTFALARPHIRTGARALVLALTPTLARPSATGAEVINEDISQYKKKSKIKELKIKFDKLCKVEEFDQSKNKNYFMGIQIEPPQQNNDEPEEEEEVVEGEKQMEEEEEQPIQSSEEEEEQPEEQNQVMFVTQDPQQKGEKKITKQSSQNNDMTDK